MHLTVTAEAGGDCNICDMGDGSVDTHTQTEMDNALSPLVFLSLARQTSMFLMHTLGRTIAHAASGRSGKVPS